MEIISTQDRLADLPALRSYEVLHYLLKHLSKLLAFRRGWWLSALHMNEVPEGDPALGWRPGPIGFHGNKLGINWTPTD